MSIDLSLVRKKKIVACEVCLEIAHDQSMIPPATAHET